MNCSAGHAVPDTNDVITIGVVSDAWITGWSDGVVSTALLGAVERSERSDPQAIAGRMPRAIAPTASAVL